MLASQISVPGASLPLQHRDSCQRTDSEACCKGHICFSSSQREAMTWSLPVLDQGAHSAPTRITFMTFSPARGPGEPGSW